jgi:AcrR family transcriptional regulator
MNRAQKRAANQTRLLEAAQRVFTERGYDGASVSEIAAESGLSNGALYYNFANKQELFLALMDERIAALTSQLETVFSAKESGRSDTAQDVRRMLSADPNAPRNRQEWTLFFEFLAQATRDPVLRRSFRARIRDLRSALTATVSRRAEEEHAGLSLPPEQVAIAIQALGWGLAAQRLIDPAAVDDVLGRLLVALLRGLAQTDGR